MVGCGSWVGVVVGWGGGGLGWWWVGTDDVGDVKTRLMLKCGWSKEMGGRALVEKMIVEKLIRYNANAITSI